MSLTIHVSDLHIGHKNVARFRPFFDQTHHDLYMITMLFLNADFRTTLYNHGDSVFTKTYDDVMYNIYSMYMKVLEILGNHCVEHVRLQDKFFMKNDNVEIQGLFKKNGLWYSHAPIHPDELRGRVNFHGHVHDATVHDSIYVNCSMESELMRYWPRNQQWLKQNMGTVEYRPLPNSRLEQYESQLGYIFGQEITRQLYDYTRVVASNQEFFEKHIKFIRKSTRNTFIRDRRAMFAQLKSFSSGQTELFSRMFSPKELAELLYNKHYPAAE